MSSAVITLTKDVYSESFLKPTPVLFRHMKWTPYINQHMCIQLLFLLLLLLLVEVICYKPGDRVFGSWLGPILPAAIWPRGRLSLQQILIPGLFLDGKGCLAFKTQPHPHLGGDCRDNVGSSTSHKPMGLPGLLQRYSYLYLLLLLRWGEAEFLGAEAADAGQPETASNKTLPWPLWLQQILHVVP
jgi:hypothetical protein